MSEKRFEVLKKIENCDIESDVIDFYVKELVEKGKTVSDVTVGILDNEEPITYKECVDLLNGQHEELQKRKKIIKQITKDYNELKQINTLCNERYRELADENEQLKQFKKEVFDLIDKKIDEYQKYDGYDTETYYIGTQLLKELKKELKGDGDD